MQAGETLTYSGYEVCLFPLDYLYCTQISEPGGYSHCCGTATDWIGTHDEYPLYAPFSCTKIYDDGATLCYINDNPVWTPSGLQTNVIISFTHDNNPPTASHFNQGDLIAHTGSYPPGSVTGDHVHLDQAFAATRVLVDSGITCQFGNRCYYIQGGIIPEQCYYLTGAETIITELGQNIPVWQNVVPITKKMYAILMMLKKRKEAMNNGKRTTSVV